MSLSLPARWNALLARLDIADTGVYEQLVEAYSEPHRTYHNLVHLSECFTHLDTVPELISNSDRDSVELALWFHDAIYLPRQHCNEADSAAWAMRFVQTSPHGATLAAKINRLIMATRHNQSPTQPDEQWIVDIDLAILGAVPARFAEYEAQIRTEYSWVVEADFRKGRAAILQSFLERLTVFSTSYFQNRFERAARENIQRTLSKLSTTSLDTHASQA